MRLFVAISLPEDQRMRLASLANGLPGARWIVEDNLHLTLRFLGELDGAEASDLDEALAGIRMPAFEIGIRGINHFGDGRNLRALWAGVEPNSELNRLHDKIEQAVIRSGLPAERRKFIPHVTLARFKSNPGPRLQEFLSCHALLRLPPFWVEGFTLFSSHLARECAIYRAEADYELERAPLAAPSGDPTP